MPDLLFVYGTLMRSYDHPMARLLTASADFIGEGSCRGRLYLVKHYPGFVRSDDAADVAYGELYRPRDPAKLLAELDAYEGCGPDDAPPTQYLREVVSVSHAGGVTDAWTYIYNWPVGTLSRIASGKFMEA